MDVIKNSLQVKHSMHYTLQRSLLAVCMFSCACQTPVSLMRPATREDELLKTDHIQGPLERNMKNLVGLDDKENTKLKTRNGLQELEQAKKLYDDKEYDKAASLFNLVVRKYRNSSLREDAMFMRGEAEYQQQKYAKAQDTYSELVKDYPSTRYLDAVSRRNFRIAQKWLGFEEAMTTDDIQPVNFDDIRATPPPKPNDESSWDPSRRLPIFPNFTDKSRPLFDTKGRALEALKSIWLNNPTGALADDAIMLTASHYLAKQDYQEADRYFTMLRNEYPKSMHLQNAFLLGSHVKLLNYQGADYSDKDLVKSEELKKSTLRMFADDVNQNRLKTELKEIEELRAKQDFNQAQYYTRRNNIEGALIYYQLVIDEYPHTSFAERARAQIKELLAKQNEEKSTSQGGPRLPTIKIPNLLPVPGSNEDSFNQDPFNNPEDPVMTDSAEEDPGRVKL